MTEDGKIRAKPLAIIRPLSSVVCHQKFKPPSRAASAKALTRP
jgi:hypothetical protein